MSPSWADRVQVLLSPRRVALQRHFPAWRRRPPLFAEALCEPAEKPQKWAAALVALERMLDGPGWSGAGAHVRVSNHFVRFSLVPQVAAVTRPAEVARLAQHHLKLVYGEQAEDWRLSIYRQAGGAPLLVGAIEQALCDALRAALRNQRLTEHSTAPYLAVAFNHYRARLAGIESFWLALPEESRLCVGYCHKGAWLAVRNQQVSGAIAEELPKLLERMRMGDAHDSMPGPVYVVARATAVDALAMEPPWSLRLLPPLHFGGTEA